MTGRVGVYLEAPVFILINGFYKNKYSKKEKRKENSLKPT